MAQNFVTTLLSVTTDCRDTDLTELLEDCATFETIYCEENGYSCEYAVKITEQIIENTLEKWNRRYKFMVKTK